MNTAIASLNGRAKQSVLSAVKSEQAALKISLKSDAFPVTAMPFKMQRIVDDMCITYGFNQDYLSCAFLSAISSSIGSSFKVKIKGAWEESAILFMVLIGRPGVNKSAPVTAAYKPIHNRDTEKFKEYKKLLAEHKAIENAKNVESAKSAPTEKPRRQQSIIGDATLEALCAVLSFNKRGVSLVMDEIAGLFKNFNRYNKGSDQEFWLQVWSNIPVSINRKNDESILIDNPFVTMIGTIQPRVLNEINKDGRSENGFIDRILFSYPDFKGQPDFHFNEPSESSSQDYSSIINRLLLLDFDESQSNILSISKSAQSIYQQWHTEQASILEANNNDRLCGIFAKIEVYVFRFSLIYQLLSWACGEAEKFEIEDNAMLSAIETAEYFKKMALKVNPIDHVIKIPMSNQRRSIYNELPKEFSTAEGVEVSLKYNLNERRFKEWLHDDSLFIKVKHGIYSKAL